MKVSYYPRRLYSDFQVENADVHTKKAHEEGEAAIISHAAFADISIITLVAIITEKLLAGNAGNSAPEILELVLRETEFAFIFAEYLRMKTSMVDVPKYDVGSGFRCYVGGYFRPHSLTVNEVRQHEICEYEPQLWRYMFGAGTIARENVGNINKCSGKIKLQH